MGRCVKEGFGTGYEFYILRFLSFLSLIYLQQVMGWKLLTFLVLSIAFNIETFKSSKAARTFSYSPRCWEKYAKNNTKYDIMKISQKDLYYSLVIMLVICCFQISYRTALLCPHCWRKKKNHSIISTAHRFIHILIWNNCTEKTISIRQAWNCEVAATPGRHHILEDILQHYI